MEKTASITWVLFVLFILFIMGCSKPNTMTGNDGKKYKTVKIGDQWWMAENLRETKFRNGDPIPNVTDDEEWSAGMNVRCAYDNNNESNADTYGYLYRWWVVSDSCNIAPKGWRVPTKRDWETLSMTLGDNQGSKMAGNASLWANGELKNNPAFGTSGFNALPSGCRSMIQSIYDGLGEYTYFWSVTEGNRRWQAWSVHLSYKNPDIYYFSNHIGEGYSVRLVKDN